MTGKPGIVPALEPQTTEEKYLVGRGSADVRGKQVFDNNKSLNNKKSVFWSVGGFLVKEIAWVRVSLALLAQCRIEWTSLPPTRKRE